MRFLTFISALFIAYGAQANSHCASNVSELNNVADILQQINPWGTWQGSSNGKTISVTLTKDGAGDFQGQASFDGQNVGPLGLTVCSANGRYTFSISFFTIQFDIVSAKQIIIDYAFNGSDTVTLNKK